MQLVSREKQKGIAALTAILVVVIATVLAVNLLWTTSVDIQRTQTVLQQDQARLYDLGGEELAKYILKDDFNTGSSGVDTTKETWAKLLVREFKEGTLEGWLVDQQGLFDLNSLIDFTTGAVNADAQTQFESLLGLLDLDPPLDSGTATELAEAAIDWLDGNTTAGLSGAEDGYYTNLQPPYASANFWFTSVSELQAVKGFTPEILLKLTPHVAALLPQAGGWPLNVNTATDLVLASLAPGQTAASVTPVYRQQYPTAPDFEAEFLAVTGVNLTANPTAIKLGVSSNWFLLTVTTTIGTTRSTMYSLLERDATGVVSPRLRTFDAN